MTTTPRHDNLLRFVNKHRASTPKQTLGVKIVQTAKTYYVSYIGAKDKKVKVFSYSPPCQGRRFVVNEELLFKYPFLNNFAWNKAIASSILLEIYEQHSIQIAYYSVLQESVNINYSR